VQCYRFCGLVRCCGGQLYCVTHFYRSQKAVLDIEDPISSFLPLSDDPALLSAFLAFVKNISVAAAQKKPDLFFQIMSAVSGVPFSSSTAVAKA